MRVAAAVDEFADRHRFPPQSRFEVQLCIEEILMYIVEHGFDDSGEHDNRLDLEMDVEGRNLVVRIVDDGVEQDPASIEYRPDATLEERVVDGLGLHLVHAYVDELSYRREGGRNHLSLSKSIAS